MDTKYQILISFANDQKGKSLLRLVHSLIKAHQKTAELTVMHLALSNEMHPFNIEEEEKNSFAFIIEESKILKQEITPVFKATVDIETDIADTRPIREIMIYYW